MQADEERRFGGLRRLYGDAAYARLRQARVAVVGVGGVGSWTVEALARSGVARLVLIDLDQVSESNVNRQLQATTDNLGMAKVEALRLRIAQIHPGCEVHSVEDFVTPQNWPAVLGQEVDAVIDACDNAPAKKAMVSWALHSGLPFVCVGAAGGKQNAQAVAVDDLSATTHDPMLAALRNRLRREGLAARSGRIGVRCVYSAESVKRPIVPGSDDEASCAVDSNLSCHGYGSSVVVTATFGMTAAGECIAQLLRP